MSKYFNLQITVGINTILFAMLISLFLYFTGNVTTFSFFTVVVFMTGILLINYIFLYEIKKYTRNIFFAFVYFISIYLMFFILRLNLLEFSFSVGDASDYLLSGISSYNNGDDIGWFLPLTAAVIGNFNSIFDIGILSFVNVLLQSIAIPVLYFFLKELKVGFYIRIIALLVYSINPLVVWFSKTTFSEPIWQLLLIFFCTLQLSF